MNILLLGEYSRLHNSLKEGLIKKGHTVKIIGFNDGFKDFPIDLKFKKKWNSGWLKKIKVGFYKLTSFDITSYLTYLQFLKNKSHFLGYDVVQLINENTFYCEPYFEKKILSFIFKNNKKVFLLSCGDDYLNVKYNFEHPNLKSIVQPYLEGKIKAKDFIGVLKFKTKSYEKLHEFLFEKIVGVIASDIDYHIPLINHPKYLGLIPNPINIDKIPFQPLDITGKIILFLGINSDSYFKKGGDYFSKALQIIQAKYPEKVAVIVTRSIPYKEYIQKYDSAHVLLDQTYANDQGYNALEAMAKGKVVFTGAELEFTKYFKLETQVNVNTIPDLNQIVAELSTLIENPKSILTIAKNARAFIEKEHHYERIAEQYLHIWETNI